MIGRAIKYVKRRILEPLLFRSGKNSTLYYLYYPFFDREHRAVLAGRLMYEKINKSKSGNVYSLRRNIHRIEKGLIMKERKPVFARDYILDTVNNFIHCSKHPDRVSKESVTWAHDVLANYFKVVGSDEVVDAARQAFRHYENLHGNGDWIPYERKIISTITYEEFLKLSRQRRSVRWYVQKQVPRDIIEKAIKVALNSPSACNRQPFKFYVFDDPALAKEIGSIPMGTEGFAQNFPAIVVVVGQLRAYQFERDRHLIYIDGALAAMSFMYALETLGIASCPINWPDVEHLEQKMAKALKLEDDQRPIMLISFGYGDETGKIPYSAKAPVDQAAIFNIR